MKFRVSQSDLAGALLACDKSLLLRANLPVLANILLSVSKNKLEILSTNLETATKVTVDCRTESEGRITLPGKVLFEFITQLSEGEVIFERLGEEMLVNSSGNRARLATMNPDEFPSIPKIEAGKQIKLNASSYLSAAKKVEFCAAQDESRPILSGILLEVEKKKLSMVSTDGYRLSFVSTEVASEAAPLKIVVPAKTVGEVAKIIGENFAEPEKQTLGIIVADNLSQANFKMENIEFTSRLIEGEFPNWQKIIPSSFATKVRISKAQLAKQVRIASIFARDSGNIIRLKFEGKTLTIMATTGQIGSGEAQAPIIEMVGKGGEIAFNFRYLLEAFSVIEEEEVVFEMIESLSPGRLTGASQKDDFFHIVMPVRLQG